MGLTRGPVTNIRHGKRPKDQGTRSPIVVSWTAKKEKPVGSSALGEDVHQQAQPG